jgi:hypothetical protein
MPLNNTEVKRKIRAKQKAARKPGKPAHQPTAGSRKMVTELIGFGYKQYEIGEFLEINKDTLAKHYRVELDTGLMTVNLKVLKNAFHKACSKDPRNNAVLIHWLKTRCGFVEKKDTDILGTLNAVLEMKRPLSQEEWTAKYADGS